MGASGTALPQRLSNFRAIAHSKYKSHDLEIAGSYDKTSYEILEQYPDFNLYLQWISRLNELTGYMHESKSYF